MSEINPGDVVRITGSFTNAAGDPADPTTITLRLRVGVEESSYVYGVDAELVRDGDGEYHLDFPMPPISSPRRSVAYRWEGTGAVTSAEEGEFMAVTRWPAA